VRIQAPVATKVVSAEAGGGPAAARSAKVPNRLLLLISVIVTAAIPPISDRGAVACTGWR
jgi:hypothetical protein